MFLIYTGVVRLVLIVSVWVGLALPAMVRGDSAPSRQPIFQITEVVTSAELDLKRIRKVLEPPYAPLSSLLKTKPGNHRVIKFVAAIWGICQDREELCKVHQVLMLQVNRNGMIEDGYFFTLEWREVPPTIYRVTKRLTLKSGLLIHELALKDYRGGDDDWLADIEGILDDVYKGERILK